MILLVSPFQGYAYTQTQTQGGGNARVTRVALPWADLLRPFRPVALDSISNTIPPPRRPTNLELLDFARIQFVKGFLNSYESNPATGKLIPDGRLS
jgi:hypothetical protein